MKLAFAFLTLLAVFSAPISARGSESALDCGTAVKIFEDGVRAYPDGFLELYVDALQTNPGCRKSLLMKAVESAKSDSRMLRWIIFVSRQEFPSELTLLAEAAMSVAPEQGDVIRDAFFEVEEKMKAELEGVKPSLDTSIASNTSAKKEVSSAVDSVITPPAVPDKPTSPRTPDLQSSLVQLPEESRELDEEIREAIARTTAKVEGKAWPEQPISQDEIVYKQSEEIRVSERFAQADESSMENSLQFDTVDERKDVDGTIRISDNWERADGVRLDESKFASGSQTDSRMAAQARQRELAPAGAIGTANGPKLRRSSVYYIPPARGDYFSTIDLDNRVRPTLVIRSRPSSPTSLR